MKKSVILGIIFLIVLSTVIAGLLMFNLLGKENAKICGPSFLAGGRDVSFCDTSCNTKEDCKFVCGCEYINKDEYCNKEGAEVDCIRPGEVDCIDGKCRESKIPANTNEVTISTDKTEYNQGEIVNITIKNANDYDVYYHPRFLYDLEKVQENIYYHTSNNGNCSSFLPESPLAPPRLLKSGSSYSFTFEIIEYCLMQKGNYSQPGILTNLSGNFRIKAEYGKQLAEGNHSIKEPVIAYSNEFSIKKQGVIITTDKTEYNLKEKVNITITSDNLVYKDYPSTLIKKESNETWEYLPLTCIYKFSCEDDTIFQRTDAPINPYIEFQGKRSIIWKQDYCFYENTTCGNSSYDKETMKNLTLTNSTRFIAEFCFWKEEDVNTSSYNAKDPIKRKCVKTNFTINP